MSSPLGLGVFACCSVLLLGGARSAPAQVLLSEPGPLERQARPITPENPIPRRLYFVMPTPPADAEFANARAAVTLRLTLDAVGSVAEIRSSCCGLIAVGHGLAASDVFVIATAEAVRQWRYEPPADPPISFDLTMAFGPDVEPWLVTHGGLVFRPVTPPPPPPPPPPPVLPDSRRDAAPWAEGALRVGGGIKPPMKIRHMAPAYPPEASAAGVQGAVVIEVRIEPDGRVQHARVIRSVPALDQAALDAVLQWEFAPTFVNGVVTPVLMTVTVQFSLSGG